MFQDYRDKIFELEGSQFPSNSYRQLVLQPAYEESKRQFLHSLMQIQIAHLKMLEEQQLVTRDEAKKIGRAIKKIDLNYYEQSDYNPNMKTYFFGLKTI